VIQGWWGKKSPFVRTPKFNINGIKDTFKKQKYFHSNLSWTTIFEGLLSLYFLFAVIAGWQMEQKEFLAYHALLMAGFGTIFYYSVRHLNLR
ncbi:MAG: histidine kinase, partial [Bacteroidota bacterium]